MGKLDGRRIMDFYKEYENTIKKLFSPQDKVIARLLQEALYGSGENDVDIFTSLSWASGNLKAKFPLTADVLFNFVDVMKYNRK